MSTAAGWTTGRSVLELPLVLATIAQRFRLTLPLGQRVVPDPGITLRLRQGMRMAI
jgi:cytochrome P450